MVKKNAAASAADLAIKTVLTLLTMAALTLAFFLVQSRITDREPSVFGYQMYIVMSGSMSPALKTGSLVMVDPVDPHDVVPGDIITFRGDDRDGNITTHRVVQVEKGEVLSFRTKGDANKVEDPMPVSANRLIGKAVFSIPYAGYAFSYARTKNGVVTMLSVLTVLVLAELIRTFAAERKAKKASDHEENGSKSRDKTAETV